MYQCEPIRVVPVRFVSQFHIAENEKDAKSCGNRLLSRSATARQRPTIQTQPTTQTAQQLMAAPSTLTRDNVKFLAIARATDKAIVACYLHTSTKKPQVDMNELVVYKEMFSKVIRAPTWKSQVTPNGRHSLECNPNKFHFTMDNDELVFAAITAKDYPIRLAFQMITNVQQEIVPKFGSKALTCREVSLAGATACLDDGVLLSNMET